jgi:hypothetical protein
MLEERKNEDLVDKGILTPYLADRMNEEWEKVRPHRNDPIYNLL